MKIAQIRPVGTPAVDVPKGLKGVVVAETEVGDVRGTEGFYHYRQYSAVDLSEKRSLEEAWFLLYEGRLPDAGELERFRAEIRPARVIPPEVKQMLPAVAGAGTFVPLSALRTGVSLTTAVWGFGSWLDSEMDQMKQDALRVSAVIPTLVAALNRIHQGKEPIDPHPALNHAANYLYMLTGEEPSEAHARAIEVYLTSTIDHGFNASTFTGRVVASTGADLGAAVVAAIGSLSGPLHGGAPSRALDMLDEIKTEDQVDEWVRAAMTKGGRIMGFGHPVYKTEDPRSVMLRRLAEDLEAPRIEFAKHVEKRVIEILDELKPGRQLRTNVEFYAAIVMETIGLTPSLFTPTFACSRVIGWTAHILEQAADNRIIRPSGRYIGPPPPQPLD
ncbi:MAG: citrate synthase/methylcitrate synthase [Actinomycetota bacterium]